jgi:hypothetical protein
MGCPWGMRSLQKLPKTRSFTFEYSSTPKTGDPRLYDLITSHVGRDKEALKRFTAAGHKLAAAILSSISIDDALYQLSELPESVTLGKVCIIRSILKAEGNSNLVLSRETGRLSDSAGRDGWIEQMFSMAVSNLKQSELRYAFNNITFINFNYDRCLEQYLLWSLQRLGVDEGTSAEVVEGLKIIRPYGTLGSSLPGRPTYLAYGYGGHVNTFDLVSRIRTYTESALHDKQQLEQIVLNAGLFVILGFGFHPQNLDLLAVSQNVANRERTRLMATVRGIHQANLDVLRSKLQGALRIGDLIELHSMTTPEMLQQLRMKILI